MSKTTLYDVRADGKDLVIVAGHFEGAGTSAPTYPLANPPGWTVSRTNTGIYKITFDDSYPALISAQVSLQAATPGDLAGHTVILDTLSAKVMEMIVYNAADAAHDLVATEFVHFVAIFRRSSVSK